MTLTETRTDPPSVPSGRRSRRHLLVPLAVLGAIAAGLLTARLATGAFRPHLYSGTVLQQSEPAPPMDGLVYASGDPVDLAAYEGEVVLVFFGYMNCPDICPMTLSSAARAIDQLTADERDAVNLLMVTVDPARDRQPALQGYVGAFDPAFHGIDGPVEAIEQTATRYGIYHAVSGAGANGGMAQLSEASESAGDEGYLIDHTASLMAIDTDGALRVIWSADVSADDLARDLRDLLP